MGDLVTALVGTGFGYDPAVREVQAATVARLLPRVRDINHWDIAAGALICERAGLAVREVAPAPPARGGVLVAAPALVDELAALVGE